MTFQMCSQCQEHEQFLQEKIAANAELRVSLLKEFQGYRMTPDEELFAKYYNGGRIKVKDMDDAQLNEYIRQLQQIATQAKATLLSASDEKRGREGTRRVRNKEWLTTAEHDKATSDALNAPKIRAARMTKLDKAKSDLLALGMDEKIVNEMIKGMERGATEKELKTVTFKKPSVETVAVNVKVENSEPFDPSKLNFRK